MTADELASFRALLRAQAEAPQRRPRFFAARRSPGVAVAVAAPMATAPPLLEVSPALELLPLAMPPADPPPRAPPLFGRRELEVAAPERAEPLTLRTVAAPAPHLWEGAPATPEAEPMRTPPSVAPGGWTRARPPSAQRRLLARLEAVFLAERLGLDARREAQRG